METQERITKERELEDLQQRVRQLEAELRSPPPHWQATEYYTAYYASAGFFLGMFGALTSLIFNVVGSVLVNQPPPYLIRVYLTFPLREQALSLDYGLALSIGCCLYIATGMFLGVPFFLLLHRFTDHTSFGNRFVVATGMAASMWLVHFYGILVWLQPLLFGGTWIVDLVPWWVGLLTHLVYGWTLLLVYPLGKYVPYHRQTEVAA